LFYLLKLVLFCGICPFNPYCIYIPHSLILYALNTLTFLLQEKYKRLHPRLPVTVAETLLHTDPQIELPLWLVHMFKVTHATTALS